MHVYKTRRSHACNVLQEGAQTQFATAADVPVPSRSPTPDVPPGTPPKTPPPHGRYKSDSEDEDDPRFVVSRSPSNASLDSGNRHPLQAPRKRSPSNESTGSEERHRRRCQQMRVSLSLPKEEILTRRRQLGGPPGTWERTEQELNGPQSSDEPLPGATGSGRGKGGGRGRGNGRGRGRGRGRVHKNKKLKRKATKTVEEGEGDKEKPVSPAKTRYWSTPKKKAQKPKAKLAKPAAKGSPKAKAKGKAKAKARAAAVAPSVEAAADEAPGQDGERRSRGTLNMPRPKRSAEDTTHRERLAARRKAMPTTIEGIMELLQSEDESMRIVLAQMAAMHPSMPVPTKDDKHLLPEYNHWQLSVYWTRQNVGILRKSSDGPHTYCGTMTGGGWDDVRVALESVNQFAPSLSITTVSVKFA